MFVIIMCLVLLMCTMTICFCFGGELGFLNCDDISMCVVNNKFEPPPPPSLFLIPFILTSSVMRFLSLLLLGMCACVVRVVIWSSLVCM